MNTLQAGFSRVNINPPLGIDIVGYYHSRYTAGILDDLEINALALAPDWKLVLPCCNVNGAAGYFPMQDSYDEGGYEARSSHYKAGTAEQLVADGIKLLDSLR